MTNPIEIKEETVNCPHCNHPHSDIDEWALKPHRTHLCLHCGQLFEGTFKGVSRPSFEKLQKPDNVIFLPEIHDLAKETTSIRGKAHPPQSAF